MSIYWLYFKFHSLFLGYCQSLIKFESISLARSQLSANIVPILYPMSLVWAYLWETFSEIRAFSIEHSNSYVNIFLKCCLNIDRQNTLHISKLYDFQFLAKTATKCCHFWTNTPRKKNVNSPYFIVCFRRNFAENATDSS